MYFKYIYYGIATMTVFNKNPFQTEGVFSMVRAIKCLYPNISGDVLYQTHFFFFVGLLYFGLRIKQWNVINLLQGFKPIPVLMICSSHICIPVSLQPLDQAYLFMSVIIWQSI